MLESGLRVDVDTFRGTGLGVPSLLDAFARHGIKATFFFSVGPDNMGRHLWRLLKPAFLWKMLRTGAPSLYGWSILRCGVVGTGPDIGGRCADVMRRAAAEGHEVGLHAWDHQRWQSMDMTDAEAVFAEAKRGFDRLSEILGDPPPCSAAPAWRAPQAVFQAKDRLPFAYNSDCRGTRCFVPVDDAGRESVPQIPVTLPTYDETVGRNGIDDSNYNDHLLGLFKEDGLNILCIHAEAEGVAKAALFDDFLVGAAERGIRFGRLDETLRRQGELPRMKTVMRSLAGREGQMCFHGEAVSPKG